MTDPSESVARIYERSCRSLVGLLAAIGGDVSDAEEVAQEAFVRLWTQWAKISRYDDPEAWLRMVAVRLLLSRMRRTRAAAAAWGRLRSQAQTSTGPPSPTLVDFEHALARLTPRHRAVVILHYVYDLPVEAVAAELGVPRGTVKSRLARARDALTPLLAESDFSARGHEATQPSPKNPHQHRGGGAHA